MVRLEAEEREKATSRGLTRMWILCFPIYRLLISFVIVHPLADRPVWIWFVPVFDNPFPLRCGSWRSRFSLCPSYPPTEARLYCMWHHPFLGQSALAQTFGPHVATLGAVGALWQDINSRVSLFPARAFLPSSFGMGIKHSNDLNGETVSNKKAYASFSAPCLRTA